MISMDRVHPHFFISLWLFWGWNWRFGVLPVILEKKGCMDLTLKQIHPSLECSHQHIPTSVRGNKRPCSQHHDFLGCCSISPRIKELDKLGSINSFKPILKGQTIPRVWELYQWFYEISRWSFEGSFGDNWRSQKIIFAYAIQDGNTLFAI